MLVVEVGFKLDKSLIYYHDMLIKNGLELDFVCISHDVYYTKNNLDNLTENQMKRSCTRIRYCDAINKEKSERTKYEAMEFIKLILTIQSTQLNVGVEIIKKRILDTIKVEKEEEIKEKEL